MKKDFILEEDLQENSCSNVGDKVNHPRLKCVGLSRGDEPSDTAR
jgi:hypothetical protein